jgi:hypothetical protein
MVKLLLRQDKKIRGKEYKAGTPVFEGECLHGLKPVDVEKAIQLQEIAVDLREPEAKKEKTK